MRKNKHPPPFAPLSGVPICAALPRVLAVIKETKGGALFALYFTSNSALAGRHGKLAKAQRAARVAATHSATRPGPR